MAKLHEIYKDTVVPELFKQFGYTSVMQVPRIVKITLNMGVGEAVADKKILENAVADLTAIAGQKPLVTKARKSVAGFKIREGFERDEGGGAASLVGGGVVDRGRRAADEASLPAGKRGAKNFDPFNVAFFADSCAADGVRLVVVG